MWHLGPIHTTSLLSIVGNLSAKTRCAPITWMCSYPRSPRSHVSVFDCCSGTIAHGYVGSDQMQRLEICTFYLDFQESWRWHQCFRLLSTCLHELKKSYCIVWCLFSHQHLPPSQLPRYLKLHFLPYCFLYHFIQLNILCFSYSIFIFLFLSSLSWVWPLLPMKGL